MAYAKIVKIREGRVKNRKDEQESLSYTGFPVVFIWYIFLVNSTISPTACQVMESMRCMPSPCHPHCHTAIEVGHIAGILDCHSTAFCIATLQRKYSPIQLKGKMSF
jgi:hypothetical protein